MDDKIALRRLGSGRRAVLNHSVNGTAAGQGGHVRAESDLYSEEIESRAGGGSEGAARPSNEGARDSDLRQRTPGTEASARGDRGARARLCKRMPEASACGTDLRQRTPGANERCDLRQRTRETSAPGHRGSGLRQRTTEAMTCASDLRQRTRREAIASNPDRPRHGNRAAFAEGRGEDRTDKLMAALTTLGFKKAECRRALGELTSCDDALSMEELIRHALALLVPA